MACNATVNNEEKKAEAAWYTARNHDPDGSDVKAETAWYTAKNHDADGSETPELSMSKAARRQRRRRELAARRKAEGTQEEDFETPTQKRHLRKLRLDLWHAADEWDI